MVTKVGDAPLKSLKEFCDRRLRGAINTVHILPFFPASSDAGFSVIDYRKVDDELGTWDDVVRISRDIPDRHWYGAKPELIAAHQGEGVDELIDAVDAAARRPGILPGDRWRPEYLLFSQQLGFGG